MRGLWFEPSFLASIYHRPPARPGGTQPTVYQGLSWQAYADLVGTMDLGLSLMYTPHPSYPPLDLAASGAVVVTNRFGNKTGLDRYSRNILCVEPTVAGLVQGIAAGIALVKDPERRAANAAESRFVRASRTSFAGVLDALANGIGKDAAVHAIDARSVGADSGGMR